MILFAASLVMAGVLGGSLNYANALPIPYLVGPTAIGADVADATTMPGALVVAVTPGGPCNNAGIEKDDIIVGVNNVAVLNAEAFNTAIGNPSPGTKISLRVWDHKTKKLASVTITTV
ncbi:PDZ domain-containing protein [Sorangium sp. So ce693]|uniref:PDZ domain-containing protein n=1 Tax=Sorangium sp. So ce693 TaxID=3133318 RepID=UPI003F5F5595